MIYKQITLNPWEPPLGEIRVIQEEADGRDLIINLIDDNGSPLDLTGKTVSVYIQKPDNTMIYNSCEVEGNQATVTLTLQMMAVSGLTKLCELQIIDTDNHTLKVTLPPLRIIKSIMTVRSRAQTNFPGWRKLSTKRTTPQESPVKPQTRPMKQLSQRTRRLRRQILRHNLLIPQPTPQLQQRNPQIHRHRRPRRRRPMRKLKATTLKPRGKRGRNL